MTVQFEHKGSTLTGKPEGRMDTATSPELAQQLQPEMEGVTDLIMDLEKIDYLSSGGLRLLLTTEQTLEDRGGAMKLIHVNEYIMEIFEMTGFTEMITIE